MPTTQFNETSETLIPYFLPQGTLLPSENGIDLTSFAFIPNCLYVAEEVQPGAPATVTVETEGLAHITLPLSSKNKIESAADLQGRPVTWSAKGISLPEGTIKIALHVVIDGGSVVSTSIIDLAKTPVAKSPDKKVQKLSSLEEAISIIGAGGLEPIQLLKKMKDSGF